MEGHTPQAMEGKYSIRSVFKVAHTRPLVMGVLNVTPDSFSDGGSLFARRAVDVDKVLYRAEEMLTEGADLLDIGGESTRPGAVPPSEDEEIERVMPALIALTQRFDVPVSVDTSSGALMRLAAEAGAALVNDVRALRKPGALEAAVEIGLPVVLMHMAGEPESMQDAPAYINVAHEVTDFLMDRVAVCEAAGIERNRLILDPGFGFGKTLEHNVALFRALPDLKRLGFPLLIGVSRKRMVGALLGKPVAARVFGSVALAMLAAQQGVDLIRVHDVGATVDCLTVLARVTESE